MSRKLAVQENEQLEHLCEEIRAILAEKVFRARMELLEAKHLVGKAILGHPLYKKYGKKSGELIKRIAKSIGRSAQDLYLCVRFCQRFEDVSTAIETLKGRKNDITWNAVRKLLEPPKEPHICGEWETIERCVVCKKVGGNK